MAIEPPSGLKGEGDRTPAAGALVFDASERDFATAVLERSREVPVVVDFWAPWCGPCKMMAPAFSEAAGRFAGTAVLAKLNTEDVPAIGAEYNIRSIPTLVVFRGGREVARQSGAMDLGSLQRFIEGHLQ